MFAMILGIALSRNAERKLSPLEEFLGRGEPESCEGTREAEKIIL
jgi:hypothetical protein